MSTCWLISEGWRALPSLWPGSYHEAFPLERSATAALVVEGAGGVLTTVVVSGGRGCVVVVVEVDVSPARHTPTAAGAGREQADDDASAPASRERVTGRNASTLNAGVITTRHPSSVAGAARRSVLL